jgi:hypothetical protein
MQERKFEELEDRASFSERSHDDRGSRLRYSEEVDAFKQLEARSRVAKVIESMKAEGKALELSNDEEQMLHSFRRFKLRMRKDGEVFKWQSRRPEGVTIAEESGLITHPQEVL